MLCSDNKTHSKLPSYVTYKIVLHTHRIHQLTLIFEQTLMIPRFLWGCTADYTPQDSNYLSVHRASLPYNLQTHTVIYMIAT